MSPKILLVLGDQDGIDVPFTVAEIEAYFKTTVTLPITLSRNGLLNIISCPFDIIIILGHNEANDNGIDGRIRISNLDTISIDDFSSQFRRSVSNGLKLVILAGCSGIGAARTLGANPINVPNVIAFRAPIHYEILRLFFERLCKYWIDDSQSLEVAVTKTREDLSIADKKTHPAASILPILYISAFSIPFKYSILNSNTIEPDHDSGESTRLPEAKPWWQKRNLKYLVIGTLSICLVSLAAKIPEIINPYPQTACDIAKTKNLDFLSCGEKSLLGDNELDQNSKDLYLKARIELKKEKPDYQLIVNTLDGLSANTKNDNPEITIARSNAMAMLTLQNRHKKVKTIVVMIPASRDILFRDRDLPSGILSAVAQSQSTWNHNEENNWKLQIIVVNDYNIGIDEKNSDPEKLDKAEKAIDFVTQEPKVLAVEGYYNSGVTKKYLDKHTKAQQTLISGTNTVPNINYSKSKYYFRNTITTDIQAENLINYLKKENIENAFIIAGDGTYAKAYDKSLRDTAKDTIKIPPTRLLSSIKNQDTQEIVNQIIKSNAKALIIVPNPFVENPTAEIINIISNIKRNSSRCLVIGSETLGDYSFWDFAKKDPSRVNGLLFSLPLSQDSDRNNFTTSFLKTPIIHRALLTFDSMNILINAINLTAKDKKDKDEDIRLQLPDTIREITSKGYRGVTGEMKFDEQGNRTQSLNGLTKLTFENKARKFILTKIK